MQQENWTKSVKHLSISIGKLIAEDCDLREKGNDLLADVMWARSKWSKKKFLKCLL